MTEKLEIVQIEESEEESQVMKLSETYWKDYLRDNEYNKDPNKMCELCIEEQIKKHGQQVIPCTGINRAENKLGKHLFDQIVDTLTLEEKAELDALYDPYVYMDTFLDIGKPKQLEDRWYQKIISACLHGDSLVSMSDGSYKKIKDIKIGDKVVSYNETKRSLPINKVTNVWNQGIKPVYRVTLENGDYLDCTRDHPILSHFKSGKENKLLNCPSYETTYKSLEDGLDVGMDVYTVNKSERWGKFSNTDVAKLLGYLITDGYINLLPDTKEKRNRRTVQFANIREEYSLEFKRICEEVFDCQVTYVVKESYIHKTTGVNRKKTYWCYVNKREKLDNFLKSIGCVDKTTREMSIFNFALNNFNEECTKYFLNRAYAGDGSLYLGKNNSIKICLHGSYKSELINNWHKILRKIGCWKSIVNNRIRNDGSSSLSLISTAISAKALLNFTGPIFGKETQSKKILSRISELDLSKRSLKRGSFNTSTRTKIVSIEYIGEHTTYDIEVENRHNFVANNIIVHNCSAQSKVIRVGRRSGKTYMMALMMVHEMLVNDKYRVLVVSPYAVQTGEVIKTFLDLCSRLPDNPVKSSKQTPVWEINFHNGSVLMGFTAATNADSVRGQTANRIVLDEVDDIPEAAIVSVMAIKMSVPDVKVWRSGTPKGERNLNRAEQDPMNKCFHYPSYVIPHYDDKMDASLRHEMGDGIGYVQEVMAIIGVANDQVFQSMFLNRAQNKLKFVTALDVIADRSRYIVTIGVDWNHDKVGTRIIVLAYDKIEPQFYIIDKEIVAIEGKTQHAAQDKIIRLNRKYNCEHIFVDKGFGTTQIANIKQFALAQVGTIPKGHPDLKLLDMLAIDYGSSTEVQDPVTGEIVKHPTKQMAVMNAVEVLEKDLIALHPKDDHDIIKQFKNYVEKSRNKGKITYGYLSAKVGDHDLDAIMIALFGMKKTYSSIFISESTQALIKFVDKNDENREESDFDEVTNMLFGISFGRKSQNNKRTENLRSNRSGGFNRRDRGRF